MGVWCVSLYHANFFAIENLAEWVSLFTKYNWATGVLDCIKMVPETIVLLWALHDELAPRVLSLSSGENPGTEV